MYKSTVTLFNYDEQAQKFFPTLLTNVEFQPHYKTEFSSDGTEDLDLSLLIAKFFNVNYERKTYGNDKTFKKPKTWNKIPVEQKSNYFTLQTGRDFFVLDDFSSVTDVNYEIFKNENDDVFFIHSVKSFSDELKHWEVTGY